MEASFSPPNLKRKMTLKFDNIKIDHDRIATDQKRIKQIEKELGEGK